MQKILYIHGYNGSPYGSSYQHLKAACGGVYELHSIDYDPTQPRTAIEAIRDYITAHQINIVIGASLGGFLTIYLSGVSRMVVNPCWNPALELPKVGYTGPTEEYEEILANFPMFHDYEECHLCSGCFADDDKLLGTQYKPIFSRYFANVYPISDGHRITAKSADEIINQYLPHHVAEVADFCTKLRAMDNAPFWDEL